MGNATLPFFYSQSLLRIGELRMRSAVHRLFLFASLIFFASCFSYAQSSCGPSLGDIARQQREKNKDKDSGKSSDAGSKVITNEDLRGKGDPKAEDASDEDQPDDDATPSQPSKSAEEWKAEIAARKQGVARLQAQMERLNSSIRFASTTCFRCAQYNERQEQKQEQVERMRQQLDQQKKELEGLQEAARKDGYGNSVWEP